MEGRLYTFLGSIGGHGQEWMILSHYILVIGIIFIVARMATRKLQLVPTGSQNVMETFSEQSSSDSGSECSAEDKTAPSDETNDAPKGAESNPSMA